MSYHGRLTNFLQKLNGTPMADNKKKLYGYTVGNKFFKDKIHALAFNKLNHTDKINLYFLDDQWKDVCWNVEPKESMHELMDIRCKQLRDSYKHISLLFSGGYDSTTILNTFIRNNLTVDELIIWKREWLPNDVQEFSYAYEVGKQIKKNIWPNIKLTVYTKSIQDIITYYKKYGKKWIENSGNRLGLDKNVRDFEFETKKELWGLHEKKDYIVIEGRDKPRLDFVDNRWYSTMHDILLTDCMNNSAEHFYFSADFPELHVKQCYLMIRWLEKNFQCTHEMIHRLQSGLMEKSFYEQWNLAIGRDSITHHESKYGIHKKIWTGGIQSYNNKMLENALKSISPETIRIWENGINEIKHFFTKFSPEAAVISPQKYIRDYIPQNSN
jgi:hypothetical protein